MKVSEVSEKVTTLWSLFRSGSPTCTPFTIPFSLENTRSRQFAAVLLFMRRSVCVGCVCAYVYVRMRAFQRICVLLRVCGRMCVRNCASVRVRARVCACVRVRACVRPHVRALVGACVFARTGHARAHVKLCILCLCMHVHVLAGACVCVFRRGPAYLWFVTECVRAYEFMCMYDYNIILLCRRSVYVRVCVRVCTYVHANVGLCADECVYTSVCVCGCSCAYMCVSHISVYMCVPVRLRQWGCVCEGMCVRVLALMHVDLRVRACVRAGARACAYCIIICSGAVCENARCRTCVRTCMYVRACECRPMCGRVCVHECVRVCPCACICVH